jgi:hypothetical protein
MEPSFSSVRYFQVLVWSRYLRPCVCWSLGIDVCVLVWSRYLRPHVCLFYGIDVRAN